VDPTGVPARSRRVVALYLALALAALAALVQTSHAGAASVLPIDPPSGVALIERPVTLRWNLDVSGCDSGKTAITQVGLEVDGQVLPTYPPEPLASGINAGLFAAAAGDGFRFTVNAVDVRTDGAPTVYRWRAILDCTGPGIPPDPTAVPIHVVGPWSEFRVTRVSSAPAPGTAPVATPPPATRPGPVRTPPKTTPGARKPRPGTPAARCYAKNFWGQDYKGRQFWRSLAVAAREQARESAETAKFFDVLNLVALVTGQEIDPDAADATRAAFAEIDVLVDGERLLAMQEAGAAASFEKAQAGHDQLADAVRGLEKTVKRAQKDVEDARGKRPRALRRAQDVLERRTKSLVKATIRLQASDTALQRAITTHQAAVRALQEYRAAMQARIPKILSGPAFRGLGGALAKTMSVLNAAQGLAAGHMAIYAAFAGIAEAYSRPPRGCKNDPLDKVIPPRRGAASLSPAGVQAATASPGPRAPVAPAVAPGVFLSEDEARAFNALQGSLARQAGTARQLQRAVAAGGARRPSASAHRRVRSLARRLAAGLAPQGRLRERLAASLGDLPDLVVDPASAADTAAAGPSPFLASSLRALGASAATQRLLATEFASPVSAGQALDPNQLLAGLGNPGLDRRAARALLRIR
jgi:hypothetical protein